MAQLTPVGSTNPSSTAQLAMHRSMLRIRRFDETVVRLVARGRLPGSIHTSIGQEAEVVGACSALRSGDYTTGTHRSHGHVIAMGTPLHIVMAELMGKSTGVCAGKGGSMHLADFSRGSLGESGIVGSGIPVATGAALACRVLRNGRVALSFFGDGAANEGVFYECMNMASIWRLPVVFLCENNQYAVHTPQRYAMRVAHISERAAGFGLPGVTVDGQDVIVVHDAVAAAVQAARTGDGPTLVEVITYRFLDHSEGIRNSPSRRDPTEVEAWRRRDPIAIMRESLLRQDIATEEGLDALDEETKNEVAAAVKFAEDSPFPKPEEAFADVYSEPIPIFRS